MADEFSIALSSQIAPQTTPIPNAMDANRPGSPSAIRSRPARLPMNQMIMIPPMTRRAVAHSHAIRSASKART
jgi:hypothetical protein